MKQERRCGESEGGRASSSGAVCSENRPFLDLTSAQRDNAVVASIDCRAVTSGPRIQKTQSQLSSESRTSPPSGTFAANPTGTFTVCHLVLLAELLHQLTLTRRQHSGDDHLEVHILMAATSPLGRYDATSLHDSSVSWLSARRNLECRLPVESGNDHFTAEHSFCKRQPHRDMDVISIPQEGVVLTHHNGHKKMASARLAWLALAPQAQVHPRIYTRGYFHLDGAISVRRRAPVNVLLTALSRLYQIQLQHHLHISTTPAPISLLEHCWVKKPLKLSENFFRRHVLPKIHFEPLSKAAITTTLSLLYAFMSVSIVDFALLSVGQDLIRFCHLSKFFGRCRITFVGVWVVFLGGCVVGALDIRRASIL
mmetsp:Transcript_16855/g.27969  ORF Transcript_16855/g.27969 Transcript_16855/m.27969 type:complete len:368 (+) Transcript_16855:43-1146(+)